MMSLTFGLFTQVSGLGLLGPFVFFLFFFWLGKIGSGRETDMERLRL